MARLHRFYVDADSPSSGDIALPDTEAHHALHVLRVTSGVEAVLFDGAGREWAGRVARADRKAVVIHVGQAKRQQKPRASVSLLQAYLNREKSVEDLVRRGTELGVARFCFFKGDHSQRHPRMQEKWARTAIECCKQCGRLWLPSFDVADTLETALAGCPETVLIATKRAETRPIREVLKGARSAAIAVGPEGDFSEPELSLALSRGAFPLSLGAATFRSEVAGALAGALVLYELGQVGPLPSGR